MELSASEVRFTHNRISGRFRSRYQIDDAVEDILDGKMGFDDFPKLTCTKFQGRLYSINNRR